MRLAYARGGATTCLLCGDRGAGPDGDNDKALPALLEHLRLEHHRVLLTRADRGKGTAALVEIHGPRWDRDYGWKER